MFYKHSALTAYSMIKALTTDCIYCLQSSKEILTGPGKISAEQAKLHSETEYEKYLIIQDWLFESDFDRFLAEIEKK